MANVLKIPWRPRAAAGAEPVPADERAPHVVVEALVLGAVFVAGYGVEIWRSSGAFFHPQLWAEDGAVWFKDAYLHGWFTPLAWPHAGYLMIFTRLVAGAGLLVPLARVPLLFVLVGAAVQVLPAVLLASNRLARIVPNRPARLLAAALYLALPNSLEVNLNLTNAQWHLGLIAALVVLAEPGGRAWRVFDVAVVFLAGLTGPFVLALVLVAAWCWWHRRQAWTAVLTVILAVLGVVQLVELATSSRGQLAPLGATFSRLVEILGGLIAGGLALGQNETVTLAAGPHWLRISGLLLLAGLAVFGAAMVTGPFELRAFNAFVILVLAGSLASPVASTTTAQWKVLALHGSGSRYLFLPTLALALDLAWLAGRLRHPPVAAVGAACLVLVAAFGIRADWSYPKFPDLDWRAQATRFERQAPGRIATFKILPPGWTFQLRRR